MSFSFNRLRNIFDPMLGNDLPQQGGFGGNMPPPSMPTFPNNPMIMPEPERIDETVTAQVEDPFAPKHEAQDRLSALIGAMPQRQPASTIRKIGNLLVSAVHGPDEAAKLFDAPFQQQLSDWGTKLKPAEYEANLERQNNTQGLAERKQAETERKNMAAEADRTARTQVMQARQARPNWKFSFDGPTVIAANPDNPKEVFDTKIPTGNLSDQSKAELQQWQTFTDKNGNPVAVNPATQTGKPITGIEGPLTKPGTAGKTSGNQTPEQLQVVQDKARQAITVIDRLIDENGKVKPEALMAVGGSRLYGLTPNLPAGVNDKIDQAKAADADIQELKSRMIINLIEEMKQQSRTGATGFGALNLKELQVLENEFAGFNPNNPEGKVGMSLKQLRDRLNKILQPADGNPEPVKSSTGTTTVKSGQIVSGITGKPAPKNKPPDGKTASGVEYTWVWDGEKWNSKAK